VNAELERTWKVVFVTSFKVPPQSLPGVAEENHENPQDSRSLPGFELGSF
jgi:hypothetical protein